MFVVFRLIHNSSGQIEQIAPLDMTELQRHAKGLSKLYNNQTPPDLQNKIRHSYMQTSIV